MQAALQCARFLVDLVLNELDAWHSARLVRLNSAQYSATRKQLLPDDLATLLDAIAQRAGAAFTHFCVLAESSQFIDL